MSACERAYTGRPEVRILISVAGLLVALVVVGWFAKAQLRGHAPAQPPLKGVVPSPQSPAEGSSPRQVQEQYQKALNDALQPQRSTQEP